MAEGKGTDKQRNGYHLMMMNLLDYLTENYEDELRLYSKLVSHFGDEAEGNILLLISDGEPQVWISRELSRRLHRVTRAYEYSLTKKYNWPTVKFKSDSFHRAKAIFSTPGRLERRHKKWARSRPPLR